VFGRVTGWGQSGPLAETAGHDIDYIALTGALHAIGERNAPTPPLNLLGDFGGGGLALAFGVVCALLEAQGSGRGQIVDAAMTDGVALLMAMTYSLKAKGIWRDERRANALDGGAPFYGVYRCADGKWLAVGALEPQFFDALIAAMGLDARLFADRWNRAAWPALRSALEEAFARRTRDEWGAIFERTDACVAPILDLDEAPRHVHNVARQTFLMREGAPEPAPAPRFSRTKPEIGRPPAAPGAHSEEILRERGFSLARIEALKRSGAL
jgi:alpha-methylacyl-CoA racemase